LLEGKGIEIVDARAEVRYGAAARFNRDEVRKGKDL